MQNNKFIIQQKTPVNRQCTQVNAGSKTTSVFILYILEITKLKHKKYNNAKRKKCNNFVRV